MVNPKQTEQVKSDAVELRPREFKLSQKPMKILAAPDILKDEYCKQIVDW
jgi:hypothetical protein